MSETEVVTRIEREAQRLGFDLAGIAPAQPVPHLDAYHAWLARGYHGTMGYLARPDRVARRADPALILPGVRSVLCVALNYYTELPEPGDPSIIPGPGRGPGHGLVARYAWGADYHALMLPRMEALAAFIEQTLGIPVPHRAYVDTGPVLERAYAARAGLGFVGKNTCLIHPRLGSWLFLGEILLDVELPPAPAGLPPRCGNCTRCMDACPTGALVAPYVLDARRCISYLTIEHKGEIPPELAPRVGRHIYGCDVCQQVCPWNRFARPSALLELQPASPDRAAPSLADLVALDEAAFQRRFGNSPIARLRLSGLLRNVRVVAANSE